MKLNFKKLDFKKQLLRWRLFVPGLKQAAATSTPWRELMRRHWTIGLGLVAALFAFWATQHYAEEQVARERDRMLPRGGLVEVLVAARDLAEGDRASAETVAVRQVPRDWALPTALHPVDFDSVNQLAINRSLKAGHPLTLDHLRQGAQVSSSLQLEPGFRAVSISVDEVSSVGGLIQPGDRVDLWGASAIATPVDSGSLQSVGTDRVGQARQARLVAENLMVIATGQRTERAIGSSGTALPPTYGSITLAVPAAVAAYVLGGQFQGRLGIALRGASDKALAQVRSNPSVRAAATGPVEILVGGLEGAL